MIHKVVAECWIGDKPAGMEIDHIDRNSHNNDYRNLRYVNHSEQMKNRVMSDRVISIATNNITEARMRRQIKTKISNNKEIYEFDSLMDTARFFRKYYNYSNGRWPEKHLQQRRKHIKDFDIIYLNAETGHANSTE